MALALFQSSFATLSGCFCFHSVSFQVHFNCKRALTSFVTKRRHMSLAGGVMQDNVYKHMRCMLHYRLSKLIPSAEWRAAISQLWRTTQRTEFEMVVSLYCQSHVVNKYFLVYLVSSISQLKSCLQLKWSWNESGMRLKWNGKETETSMKQSRQKDWSSTESEATANQAVCFFYTSFMCSFMTLKVCWDNTETMLEQQWSTVKEARRLTSSRLYFRAVSGLFQSCFSLLSRLLQAVSVSFLLPFSFISVPFCA